jgi:hypothetical protein
MEEHGYSAKDATRRDFAEPENENDAKNGGHGRPSIVLVCDCHIAINNQDEYARYRQPRPKSCVPWQ